MTEQRQVQRDIQAELKGLRGCLSKLPQHKPSTHSDPQARLLDKCSSSKAYARWQALATSYPFLA